MFGVERTITDRLLIPTGILNYDWVFVVFFLHFFSSAACSSCLGLLHAEDELVICSHTQRSCSVAPGFLGTAIQRQRKNTSAATCSYRRLHYRALELSNLLSSCVVWTEAVQLRVSTVSEVGLSTPVAPVRAPQEKDANHCCPGALQVSAAFTAIQQRRRRFD